MTERKKILVVEDDVDMHEFFSGLFAAHAVTFATSGEDALTLLDEAKDAPFGLIFLDLELLGMTGLLALDAMRAKHGDKLPPVVVCSCITDAETRKTAAEKGAAAFVPKPINLASAFSIAQRLLSGGG